MTCLPLLPSKGVAHLQNAFAKMSGKKLSQVYILKVANLEVNNLKSSGHRQQVKQGHLLNHHLLLQVRYFAGYITKNSHLIWMSLESARDYVLKLLRTLPRVKAVGGCFKLV